MKIIANKNSVEALSNITWKVLGSLFGMPSKPRPPVFLYLSSWSEGSLKKRTAEEIALVHQQQRLEQGVALISPPAAWIANVEQVPEEVSHLFALVSKDSSRPTFESLNPIFQLKQMSLHEAFGRLGSNLASQKPTIKSKMSRPKKRISSAKDLWAAAHREGYFLGDSLSRAYFEEKISEAKLQEWFQMDWNNAPEEALRFLYGLLKQSPPTADFR